MSIPVDSATRRSRTLVWMLFAVFFAPLLIAFILYYGAEGWRPAGGTNHGELITPARPLPTPALTSAANAALEPHFLRGKWTLVYIGEGRCDARCREALTLMRQTRLALNDDLTRVQRVFLATGECCDERYLEAEHRGLIAAKADGEAAASLLKAFPGAEDGGSGRIYIVDPLGNLMMSYAPDAPPKGLFEDLKTLLKWSHIG
jgi:cytochrome oxidase Cu insertion factor (SCO1/SenC/PrrC family)